MLCNIIVYKRHNPPSLQAHIWYISFQKEFCIFLSVEEYEIPDVRNGLFEQYLQRYLGYNEEKELNHVDEKVTN